MSRDQFDYPAMVQRALVGVVREALSRVAADGLPGAHHFYLTFRTGDDGVEVPAQLRARFPDEMTIVLQNKFWGLEVEGDHFAVTLSFGGRSERLVVPFAALTGFADPSVNFGLRFGGEAAADDAAGEAPPAEPEAPAAEEEKPADGSASIVSLDKFRKK
ncbi:MAG: SspB family protein [Rhodospirillales bacterium]